MRKRHYRNKLINRFLFFCTIAIFLTSFIFISKPPTKLPVVFADACTPGNPIRTGFTLSNTLPANDDGSTGLVPIGFTLSYFGLDYNSIYINNNGNITFDSSQSSYTPMGMQGTPFKTISPFFGDVDTRGTGSGVIEYGQVANIEGHKAFVVNWPDVGYYGSNTDKLNTFQLVIIEREDLLPAGQWDFEFNYGQIQWETGDASDGVSGLGGSSAAVGFTDGETPPYYYEFYGSLVPGSFLDSNPITGLIHNSRNSSICGRYSFSVSADGVPDVPPLPEVTVVSDVPDPSTQGAPYTVLVSVAAVGEGPTPAGDVTVSDGFGKNCDITLNLGVGSCELTSTEEGTLTLTAFYHGDANYSASRDSSEDHQVTYLPPAVLFGPDTNPANGSVLTSSINTLTVAFNKDVISDGGSDAANNVNNYLLVEANGDGFQTIDCNTGADLGDTNIPITNASYSNGDDGSGPYIATLTTESLEPGLYQLFVCGTSSIYDEDGHVLNDGSDSIINFTIQSSQAVVLPDTLPATGFAPDEITQLKPQSVNYSRLGDIWLEIPRLNLQIPIVGIPQNSRGEWDITWLTTQAGWLNGTSFPGAAGNSVLTSHVYNADGTNGPFVNLKTLIWGDKIILHSMGNSFVYEVRKANLVSPYAVPSVMKHESQPWLTLITCQGYNEQTNLYDYRNVVKAILIKID